MKRWRRREKELIFVILAITTFSIIHITRKKHDTYWLEKIFHPNSDRSQFISPQQTAKGLLNVAIWEEICGYQIESLKKFPLFPHGPSTRLQTSSLRLHFTSEFENFGLQVSGFFSPSESGAYSFYLDTSGTSELWISSDSKPENSELITSTTAGLTWQYNQGKRNSISLLAGKRYYIEILLKYGRCEERRRHFHVKWRSSSWKEHELREIPSDVFIAYENDSNGLEHIPTLDRDMDIVLPMHAKYKAPTFVNEEVQRRAEMYRLPFVSESDSQDLFPPCRYNPSYLVKRPLKRYESTWEMHYTSIYPFDYSDVLWEERKDFVSFGNDLLEENIAKTIVSQVLTQLKKNKPG